MQDSENPESDTSSGEDCFGDVGFMFDNALPKTKRSFRFGDVSVAVRVVDDDPGAVQSGHYVWPAAPALSAYLVEADRRLALPCGGLCLELGAGCGLAGLVAAQLESTSAVVFTDHDPGVLDMIQESIAEQGRDPEPGASKAAAKCRCVPLSWGPVGETQRALLADALSRAASAFSAVSPPSVSQDPDGDGDGGHCDTTRSGVRENYVGGGDGGAGTAAPTLAAVAAAAAAAGGLLPKAAGPKKTRQGTDEEVGLEQDDGGGGGRICIDGCGGGSGGGGDGGGGAVAAAPAAAVAFDLVIASDVIYSVSVVRPLFQTVSDLLRRRRGGPPAETSAPPPDPAAAAARRRGDPGEEKEQQVGESRAGTAAAPAGGGGHWHDPTMPGEGPATTSAPPLPPPPPPLQGESQGGSDGLPVFLMSQSFGYDAETERDIDRACRELGFVREVVWDELPVAAPTPTAPGGQEQQPATRQQPLQPPPPPPPQGDGGGVVQAEGASLDGGGGDDVSGSCCSGSEEPLLLSRQLRVGSKLQRFWRL